MSPSPRPKYNFKDVTKEIPLKIPIRAGNDRDDAMKALRAAYAWGKRHNVTMFGKTERLLDRDMEFREYMVIRRHP